MLPNPINKLLHSAFSAGHESGMAKSAVVKQDDETGKWILWTRDKKRKLGTHDTAQEAYAQEYAIQKSKERDSEKAASISTLLRRAINQTHTHPTKAQITSGNYRKGTLPWKKMTIKIENPEGTTRRGVGKDGKTWERKMTVSYGYIKGTKGKDGDALDVFLGPDLDSDLVAVIDQEVDRKFDEHKIVVGIKSEEEARKIYLANYGKGWRCGPLTLTTVQGLRNWIANGDTNQPFAGQEKSAGLVKESNKQLRNIMRSWLKRGPGLSDGLDPLDEWMNIQGHYYNTPEQVGSFFRWLGKKNPGLGLALEHPSAQIRNASSVISADNNLIGQYATVDKVLTPGLSAHGKLEILPRVLVKNLEGDGAAEEYAKLLGKQASANPAIATLVSQALPGIEKDANIGKFIAKTLPSAVSRLGQAAPALFQAAPKSLGNTSGRLGNFAKQMGWKPGYRDMMQSRRNLHVVEEMGPKQRLYTAGNKNILDANTQQRYLQDLGDNSLGHYQPGNHVIRYRNNPSRNTKRHELTHAYQFSTPGVMKKMVDWTGRGSGLKYNIGNAAIEAQAQIAGTQGLRKGLKAWGDVSRYYEGGAKGIDRMPYIASRAVGEVAENAPAIAAGGAALGTLGVTGAALANANGSSNTNMAQNPTQPNYAPAYEPAQEKAAAPNPALLLLKLQKAGIKVTPEHLTGLQKHLGALTHAGAMASRDSADAAIRKSMIFGGANLPQANKLFYGGNTIKTLTGGKKSPGLHQTLQDLINHVQPPKPPKPTNLTQGELF